MNTARQLSEQNGRRAEILIIFLYRLIGCRLIKKEPEPPLVKLI
mgnify:CR=1 FL=1|jgi:hypothetical protein